MKPAPRTASGSNRHDRPFGRRLATAAAVIAWAIVIGGATPAIGSIPIGNFMSATVSAEIGPRFYEYATAATVGPTDEADFDAGTYTETVYDAGASALTLERFGDVGPTNGSWWDTAWKTRRCFAVDNPGAVLTEHMIPVEIDTVDDVARGWLDPDGDDLRAIADNDVDELPIWIEGPVDSTETVVWVQLDDVPVGASEFCLYWNNSAAASVSDQGSVFTTAAPEQKYYVVSERFTGAANPSGRLTIVSYVDDNTVIVDGDSRTLDAGDTFTWRNVSPTSVVESTGPIGGRGVDDRKNALVPVSFAATDLLFPTNRGTQRWSIQAPYGPADVEIYNGTVLTWSGTVGATPIAVTADVSNNRSGIVRSTNGEPILVVHHSTQGWDVITVPPFLGDDIYGVRSRGTYVGAVDPGTQVDIERSDGTSQTVTLAAGEAFRIYDSADGYGDGTAVRFTNMTGIVGGVQQADGNGLESTSFLPESLLDATYYLPTDADYLAFACPTPGTMILVDSSAPIACGTTGSAFPGHGFHGAAQAGDHIRSQGGEPFFAYYQDRSTNDETNLFGMKVAAQKPTNPPTFTSGPREGIYPPSPVVGRWESPVYDTTAAGSNIFGLLDLVATLPLGTTATFRVASGPDATSAAAAPFLGPDGTALTTYSSGDPVAYALDLTDRFVRVELMLETTDPLVTPAVETARLGHDLVESSTDPTVVSVAAPGPVQTDWLLRVYLPADPAAATTELALEGTAGFGPTSDATVITDHPASHVIIDDGSVVQPSGPLVLGTAGTAHSIGVTSQDVIGASFDIVWRLRPSGGTAQLIIDHRVTIGFTP